MNRRNEQVKKFRQKNELSNKRVNHYTETVKAFFTTVFEGDKLYFTLSSASIALLIGFINTSDKLGTLHLIVIFIALAFFSLCAAITAYIYELNKTYLVDMIQGNDLDDKKMDFYDRVKRWSFISGIVITFVTAVLVGFFPNKTNELNMKNHYEKIEIHYGSHSDDTTADDAPDTGGVGGGGGTDPGN